MNSIEKLVAKLCPDGVEFRALGELCIINRGRVISKDYLRKHSGPYPVYSSQTMNGGVFGMIDTYDYDFESVTWTTDGANAGSVFYHRGGEKFSITNVCGLLRISDENRIITKFLYYILGNHTSDHVNKGMGNPKLMSNTMKKIRIPVPPLEIQQEIVNILDTFTELLVELEAELEARRLQYQYYRDELLNFSGAPSAIHRSLGLHTTDKVEFKALKDLGSTYGGLTGKNKSDFTDGNARYITYLNIANNISVDTTENEFVKVTEKEKQNRIELGDVLFTGSSETPNEVGMSSEVCSHPADPIFLNSFCFGFRFDDKDLFESGFLKYLFRSNDIRKQIIKCANGVTRFNISKNRFMKIFIPIPPLEIQREIVSILDKFEALINDLSVGIPAEIDARRQQYEYYRNKLLTFKEKV